MPAERHRSGRRGGPRPPPAALRAHHPALRRPGHRHRRPDGAPGRRPGLAHRHGGRRGLLPPRVALLAARPARPPARGHRRARPAGLGDRAGGAPGLGLGQVGAAARGRRAHRRPRPGRTGAARTAGASACSSRPASTRSTATSPATCPSSSWPSSSRSTIIAVVAGADWISAVLIAVTVPLIPVFMAPRGPDHAGTARRPACARSSAWPGTSSTWWPGLPTLKVFGRAKAQARAIAEVTDRYRTTTLATLRLTFLSSLILELLATVSVALVAVAVGLRLLDGGHELPRRPLRARPGARGLPAPARPSAPTSTPAPTG